MSPEKGFTLRNRQTCVGCMKSSPETNSEYTLISSRFGWRIIRYLDESGAWILEWRCPACWREYKNTKLAEQGPDAVPESVRVPPSSSRRASGTNEAYRPPSGSRSSFTSEGDTRTSEPPDSKRGKIV